MGEKVIQRYFEKLTCSEDFFFPGIATFLKK